MTERIEPIARGLVEFDRALAQSVLELIAHELGAEEPGDLPQIRAYLSRADAHDTSSTSTAEWKYGLARFERLRSLGLALCEALVDRE